jgi:SsrA-binding protein
MEPIKIITVNRKARFDFEILDTIEAGIALTGTEIKSIRDGKVSLREAFARPEKGEVWLLGAHIAQYPCGNRNNHEPGRPRKLLLHRKEISTIIARSEQKGLTIVPLKLYLKKGLAKVELGIARGKKQYDKRDTVRRHETDREMERAIKKHA